MENSIITDNGVPIHCYPNKNLHSFCIGLYIKAGSLYETNETNGVTHFWEHIVFRKLNMLFKGKFYKTIDRLGISFTASTYKEFVLIKVTGASKHFNDAAHVITRVFEPIKLTAKELELEKSRIKSEKRETDEEASLDYFTQKILWEGTPLVNTILGKNKVIDRIGIKRLGDFQSSILSLNNFFFYVTGNFHKENIDKLNEYTSGYSFLNGKPRLNIAPLPECFFKRGGKIEIKNNTYNLIRFSFDIDTSKYTYAELDLLYDILFSGESSKLYQELSEKAGYIYSFDARIERYNNIGNLYFSFEVQKKNIMLALQKIIDLLKALKTNITDELVYVLPSYIDNAEIDFDDAESLNWNMAYECHIIQNTYKSIKDKKKEYSCVKPERMMAIAKEIFTQDNMLITLKTNKKTFDINEAYSVTGKL